MPSRGELISAGFAGLAGILETSSEEDEEEEIQCGSPARPQHCQPATDTATSHLGSTMHGAGRTSRGMFINTCTSGAIEMVGQALILHIAINGLTLQLVEAEFTELVLVQQVRPNLWMRTF